MTYTALVRGSSPLGYWKLNGSGSAVVGTAATVSNASAYWTTPPLVANSGSSLKIVPGGASVSIYDTSFKSFYKKFENSVFSIEFWFSFNGTFDGSGYMKNLTPDTRYYTDYKLKIVRIMNGSTEIGSVLYDYNRNTFRFIINGNGNTEAYIPVRNLNTHFYIVATYSSGLLKIMVNGEIGAQGYVSDTSLFPARTSGSVTYRIDGTSINASTTMNYVIGDLAMYGYELSQSSQKGRVLYALSADKPASLTNYLQTSYFDFSEKNYHMIYKESLVGDQFAENNLYENNAVFDRNDGIKYIKITDLGPSDDAPSSSTVISSSGVTFSASNSALVFREYGKIFDTDSFRTITCMFTPLNASGGYLFSIPNCINKTNDLFAYASSSGVDIGYYDSTASIKLTISTIPTTLSASSEYEFGICIDKNDNAVAYVGDSGTTLLIENFDISAFNSIVIGNLVEYPLTNNLRIRNFGMNKDAVSNFASYNFEQNKMLMARLISDYSVSQMATIIRSIPTGNYDDDVMGSRVSWDGMDNCLVETSADGYDWQVVKRGESIRNLMYGDTNQNVLIRVSVPYEYTTEALNQSFTNLDISLYKTMNFVSDDGDYYMTVMSDTPIITYPICTIKRLPAPILMRQEKPGLYFDKFDTVVGYACAYPTSSAFNISAVDFWFKPNSFPSASNFLIHVSSSSNYYVYISGSTQKVIYSPSAAKLYINGSSVSSNSYTASAGELYHMFFDLSGSAPSSASVFLNSYSTTSATHSHGSYAHLNIWTNTLENGTASARYANFVSNNSTMIEDSTTLYWQPNWNSSSIVSSSAYKTV